MRALKVQTKANKTPEREALPIITLVLLLAGVFGILLLVKSSSGIDYSSWIVFSVTACLCWALWYSLPRSRPAFYAILVVSLLVCGLIIFYLWEELWEQLLHVRLSFQGDAEEMRLTQLALVFAILLSILLFLLECLVKSHSLVYLLTTALLILSPLIGIHAEIETVFLLIVFQLAFWALRVASRRGGQPPLSSARTRVAGKSAIAFALILALVFLVSLPLVLFYVDALYDTVYVTEGFVRGEIRSLMGRSSKPIASGRVSPGNNYQTGAAHLFVTADIKPTETLYLRGFTGGDYLGGEWARADDNSLSYELVSNSSSVTNPLARAGWNSFGGTTIDEMYYTLNDAVHLGGDWAPSIGLTIQHCNDQYENAYEPYYSMRGNSWGDSFLSKQNQGYRCLYFEQKDMNINWELAAFLHNALATRTEYLSLIRTAYTQVPTDRLPRLTALAEETPLMELNVITAYILYILHSNTTYSLTPGWSAFNQDIAEYFLYERGKGFCEHYATTATLLYRLYGVPARYVAGYMVPPEAFEPQEDGTYRAVVTDRSAHAWTEIFLEEYGWTPVEVTPASDGSTIAAYPGLDSAQIRRIWQLHGWNILIPSFQKVDTTILPTTTGNTGLLAWLGVEDRQDLLLLPLIALCYTVVLLPLYLVSRRTRLLQDMKGWNCRISLNRLVDILHFGGFLPESVGAEEDLALRLAEGVPQISREEAERLVTAATESAFGPSEFNQKEDAFARSLYHRVAESVYAHLSRRKKFAFKWFKVFG